MGLRNSETSYIRWRPVAPTGFPHALTTDDMYDGYFLPKGATVYANIQSVPVLLSYIRHRASR